MNKLFIITLEKLDKRYTVQFYNQWKQYFSKDFSVKYIDGIHMEEEINKGKFLDFNRTNMWKAVQVEQMATMFDEGKIKDGDKFLFMDGWHFGITALKYMSQLNKIDIKIYAYFHDGTWDAFDPITQAGMGKWAKYDELAWFTVCDGSFVASNFHKKLIVDYFKAFKSDIAKKIYVVGFPMNWKSALSECIINKSVEKEDLIVFPHRLSMEKQPEVFDKLKGLFPQYKFIKTMDEPRSKVEYYELIKKAKVVFSANLLENYGIGMVEGVILGCIPVLPDRLCYSEMYDEIFKYKTFTQSKKMIEYFMKNYNDKFVQEALLKNKKKLISDSMDAFTKMTEVMLYGE